MATGAVPRDVQDFLSDYPGQEDEPSMKSNLCFYRNEIRCRPDNLLIDEIHSRWQGDYDTLEYRHGFVQWLFPIQEHGMNWESQPLQKHEREEMRRDPEIVQRVLRSYTLMLDFYGMRLVDPETGLVDRSLPPRNYASRYQNLLRSTHNNLRISRILKNLDEMGVPHLSAGFLLHILSEQSEHRELLSNALTSSMDRWWANCIRNEEERDWIRTRIASVRQSDAPFTRETYEQALLRRKQAGSLVDSASK